MNMLDNQFDPYQAMLNMDKNIQSIITAHNLLAQRVEEQQKIIDTLIKGLDAANRANELMLSQGLDKLYKNFSSTGEH